MKKYRIKKDFDEDTVVKYCAYLIESAYDTSNIQNLQNNLWVFDLATSYARSLFDGSLLTHENWEQCYNLMDEMYEVLFEGKKIFEETGD